MSIVLRAFQQNLIDLCRQAYGARFRSILVVSPTGSGKTYFFCAIILGAIQRGNTVVILVHRMELVDQVVAALAEFGIECDILCADYPRRRSPVMVASVQTLIRRIDKIQAPSLLVCDEAHHVSNGSTWAKIFTQWSSAKRLGVTATPIRLDGRGLGEHFDKLLLGPTVDELIEQGYLAKPRVFAPPTIDVSGLHTLAGEFVTKETEERANKPSVTGDALIHYRQHADGKPALAFCVSVQHATDVAAQFRAAGYSAVMLKGGMDRQLRRTALADFKRGAINLIASCEIFNEGVDAPGVHCGIFLRPTQSLGLWRQQIGRVMRPAEGKDYALILDHASNSLRHGLPTHEPEWSLSYDEKKGTKSTSISVRVCSHCFAASSSRALVCANCGKAFAVEPRKIEEREGELVEVTPEMIAKKRERQEQGRSQTLEQLRAYCIQRGWNPARAEHIMAGRMKKRAGK
jgi:DNA repair protein RadD